MTSEKLSFVEKHDDQIAAVQKLDAQYRSFILQELKSRLEDSAPGNTFDIREDTWPGIRLVFRCYSPQWGKDQVVLYKETKEKGAFSIRAYLEDVSEPRLSNAKHSLKDMEYTPDSRDPFWTSRTGYDSREKAVEALCELAKIVASLRN
jgi:hypothetical protein